VNSGVEVRWNDDGAEQSLRDRVEALSELAGDLR